MVKPTRYGLAAFPSTSTSNDTAPGDASSEGNNNEGRDPAQENQSPDEDPWQLVRKLVRQVALLEAKEAERQHPPKTSEFIPQQKKTFTGVKIYGKDPEMYHGGEYAKFDLFVYNMEQVFRGNEGLEQARNPESHKVTFASSYLKGSALNICRTAFRNHPDKAFTWTDLKKLLARHVKRAKSLHDDIYSKWSSAEQRPGQSVTDYKGLLTYWESLLLDAMKPNEQVALANFRKGLRLEHRRRLKNLPEQKTLTGLIEQVMDFEEGEELDRKEKNDRSKKRSRHASDYGSEDEESDRPKKMTTHQFS